MEQSFPSTDASRDGEGNCRDINTSVIFHVYHKIELENFFAADLRRSTRTEKDLHVDS